MTTNSFPDISLFRGYYEPVRAEVDIEDLEIIAGEVPKDIKGTLLRVGLRQIGVDGSPKGSASSFEKA